MTVFATVTNFGDNIFDGFFDAIEIFRQKTSTGVEIFEVRIN